MEESIEVNKEKDLVDLPPGFRFHPTDEEIITHYLTQKAVNCSFTSSVIGEIDLNKCEPWDMPSRAKMGEKEWYFFCHRDRKYPTGTRTNRATELGYWKATGKDKEIYKGKGQLVGMKKTLVFYCGRAPKGEKTEWVMHEYRLEGKLLHNLHRASKDDWVVCRVLHRITGMKKPAPIVPGGVGSAQFNSYIDNDLLDFHSPPPLIDLACSIGPTSLGFNDAVEDNEFKFMKGVDSNMDLSLSSLFVPKSSDGSYFYFPSRGSELQDQMECHSSGYPPMMTMKMMNPTDSHWDPLAPSSFQAPGSTNPSFLLREQQSRPYCKDEQFSNPNRESMVSLSQDTSRSIDISNTAEISSSKQEKFETLTGQDNSIEDDIADIDCLWDL